MWTESSGYLAFDTGMVCAQQWFAGSYPDQSRPLADTYFQVYWPEPQQPPPHYQPDDQLSRVEEMLQKQSASFADNFRALQRQIHEGALAAAQSRESDLKHLTDRCDDFDETLKLNADHFALLQQHI